jgi:hypothetical protein
LRHTERHEIEARYAVWEIVGQPEYRRPLGAMFSPGARTRQPVYQVTAHEQTKAR